MIQPAIPIVIAILSSGSAAPANQPIVQQATPPGPGGTPPVATTPVPSDPWPAWPPPPIYRGNPRGYTAGLDLTVSIAGDGSSGPLIDGGGGTLTMGIVNRDPFCVADLRGLQTNARDSRFKLVGPVDAAERQLVFQVPNEAVAALNFRATWPVIAFSSLVDEQAASSIAWPRQWDAEAMPFLAPSAFIESNNQVFKNFVARVSEGQLRKTPVYLAAKDLVRRTILEFRSISGSTMVSAENGFVRGYRVRGATVATEELAGSPADLTCACIAVLRAAGIPARPVIGMDHGRDHKDKSKLPKGRTSMCVWAEFHLPGAGWVPFDPWQMRGQGLPQKDVRSAWRWFGSIDDMNRRIALGYDFAPYAFGVTPDWPAGWSWRVNSRSFAPGLVTNVVSPVMVSHGPVRP